MKKYRLFMFGIIGISLLACDDPQIKPDPDSSVMADQQITGDQQLALDQKQITTDAQPDVKPDLARMDVTPIADLSPVQFDGGWDADPRTWGVEIVDETPHYKGRASVSTGPAGEPHLTYGIATHSNGSNTPAIWHATKQGTAWTRTLAVAAEGVSKEYPVLIMDQQGHSHLFYNAWVEATDQVDIFYVTSTDQQTFSTPVNLTNSANFMLYAPDVAMDNQGNFHLVFQRGKNSIGYLKVVAGQPQPVEVITSDAVQFSLSPDYGVAVASNGHVHAVYCKPSVQNEFKSVLFYRDKTTDWQPEIQISNTLNDVWGPNVAIDGTDTAHLVYVSGLDWGHKTLTYNKVVGGVAAGEQPISSSTNDRSYYMGLQAVPNGTLHVAFLRFYEDTPGGSSNADIMYIKGRDGQFWPEERITETPDLDEQEPVLARGPGAELFISFAEDLFAFPDGKVYLGSK